MATFRPPGAEKLIFSAKTLACSIDCAPNRINATENQQMQMTQRRHFKTWQEPLQEKRMQIT